MNFDLIIIGAGPGGYVTAIKAAQLGMHVAVIEKDKVGGTCLNRGCIPTKSLLHSADVVRKIKEAANEGVTVADFSVDIEKMFAKKNQVVEKIVGGVEQLLKGNQIELISGIGRIVSATEVKVGSTIYTTKNILIATGSSPAIPPITGRDLPNVITSNELLQDASGLKSLVIIGGGVIGVEFASIFSQLGCEITILEACDTLLPYFDDEMGKKLALQLKKQGIKVYTKAFVEKIEEADSLVCTFQHGGETIEVTSDKVLIATGRKAYYEELFDGEILVDVAKDGVKVDEHFATSVPGIYAIGDVVSGNMQLAHLASAQGVNAVLAMNQQAPEYDVKVVPACIYTTPELASVGLTEKEAKTAGIPVKVAKYNMAGNSKTMISGDSLGFIKIVAHEETQEILGAQMMCQRATDMISEFSTAIVNRLTVADGLRIIHPHPTYNEGIGEAYENLQGIGIHTMPMKKN